MVDEPFDIIVGMQVRNEGTIIEAVVKGITRFCEL